MEVRIFSYLVEWHGFSLRGFAFQLSENAHRLKSVLPKPRPLLFMAYRHRFGVRKRACGGRNPRSGVQLHAQV
jgi:hypothetical protein